MATRRAGEEGGQGAAGQDAGEFASPACSLREADDAWAGYATRDEVLALLDMLLEAERAGAIVAARSAAEALPGARADLLEGIGREEARWCAMLARWRESIGAPRSDAVGAFREKALAIADPDARLAFLGRGQAWVARKLREALPRLRDDALHRDLRAMLAGHEDAIARVAAALGQVEDPARGERDG